MPLKVLYFVGTDYCGCCAEVKAAVLRLKDEFPGQVSIVDTQHYCGDLKRIDSRQIIKNVPVCVIEDSGREVKRIVGSVEYECLRRALAG